MEHPERGFSLKKTIKDVFKKCIKYSVDHQKHLSEQEILRHAEAASRKAVNDSLLYKEFLSKSEGIIINFIREKLRDEDVSEDVIEKAEKDIKVVISDIFKKLARGKDPSEFSEILEGILKRSVLTTGRLPDEDIDLFPSF